MNLRKIYEAVVAIIPKTKLEKFAQNTMINTFPDNPTTGVYAGYEERGYSVACEIMVPDIDFIDKTEYSDWLKLKTTDEAFVLSCLHRYESVEGFE